MRFAALRLIDGPLAPLDRETIVERMAAHLVEFDAHHNEADAKLSLRFKGFRGADIVMLIDDARQVAVQAIVAREMAGS